MPIIKDNMQQGPALPAGQVQDPAAPAPGAEQSAPGEDAATPEEQDAFKRVELAAIDILYNKKSNQKFIEMLTAGAKTPAKTMAQVAMQVYLMIDEASGGKIPVSVVFQGAVQVLEVVRDMVEKVGLFEVDDAIIGKAVQEMIAISADKFDWDPEEVQELMTEYQGQQEQMVAQQQQYAGVQ